MSSICTYANLFSFRNATLDTCHVCAARIFQFFNKKCKRVEDRRIVHLIIFVKRIGMSPSGHSFRTAPFARYVTFRYLPHALNTKLSIKSVRGLSSNWNNSFFRISFIYRMSCSDVMTSYVSPAMTLLFDWYCAGDDRVGLNYNRRFRIAKIFTLERW